VYVFVSVTNVSPCNIDDWTASNAVLPSACFTVSTPDKCVTVPTACAYALLLPPNMSSRNRNCRVNWKIVGLIPSAYLS
jgi:hypothetical protein